jgi:hypothetical protein
MWDDQKSGKRDYGDVPQDYPHVDIAGALAGAHPKLALVEFDRKYYVPGDTSEERLQDWLYSEGMVQHFLLKCPELTCLKLQSLLNIMSELLPPMGVTALRPSYDGHFGE